MAKSYELDENFVKRLAAVVPYIERLQRNDPQAVGRRKDTLPIPIKRFELSAALTPGGSAEAYALNWSDTDGDCATDTDDVILVYDVLGKYRGRAALDTDNPGFRGYARRFYGAQRWEIIEIQQQARFIEFSLDSALLATEASEDATVTNFWDGLDPDPLATGITVWNQAASSDYIFAGDSADIGIARYDVIDGKYRIIQLECS